MWKTIRKLLVNVRKAFWNNWINSAWQTHTKLFVRMKHVLLSNITLIENEFSGFSIRNNSWITYYRSHWKNKFYGFFIELALGLMAQVSTPFEAWNIKPLYGLLVTIGDQYLVKSSLFSRGHKKFFHVIDSRCRDFEKQRNNRRTEKCREKIPFNKSKYNKRNELIFLHHLMATFTENIFMKTLLKPSWI